MSRAFGACPACRGVGQRPGPQQGGPRAPGLSCQDGRYHHRSAPPRQPIGAAGSRVSTHSALRATAPGQTGAGAERRNRSAPDVADQQPPGDRCNRNTWRTARHSPGLAPAGPSAAVCLLKTDRASHKTSPPETQRTNEGPLPPT
ncbi:unnamed protein product [Gadus morhua 'NCC']